jgi:Bifunctional DNA primase/polymerase, N-terminal
MTDAMLDARSERRQQLRANGYMPLPLFGKVPPLKEWQKLTVISRGMIALWEKVWPDAINTGCLTRAMPALDIDIRNEEAARAIEDLTRERFEERGWLLVRIGQPPKRAIIFRTNTPFRKLTVNLTASNGSAEKLEFLCDGQQVVVDGEHPDTRPPYRWFGGVPWDIAHAELPYLHEHEARALIDDAATLLTTAFGYTRTAAAPKSNGIRPGDGGEALWKYHLDNIRAGRALHDSFRDLAAMLIGSGMEKGALPHIYFMPWASRSGTMTPASKQGCATSRARSIPPTPNIANNSIDGGSNATRANVANAAAASASARPDPRGLEQYRHVDGVELSGERHPAAHRLSRRVGTAEVRQKFLDLRSGRAYRARP